MPTRSALARLQQFTTCGLLALSLAWCAWQWHDSRVLAIAGAFAIFLVHSLFLALEFVLLKIVGRHDAAGSPSARELLRAWWAETWTAVAVFYWRQPFRWRAEPDFVRPAETGTRGVVLVHGFVCNRGFWNPWMSRLREQGIPFIAVNLEPVFGSIDDYTGILEAAVSRMAQATGERPLIVAHSMGGVAVRAWMRERTAGSRVHGVVTIATPHGGTWLGRFSRTPNGRQMRLGSAWLRKLAPQPSANVFTCWYSNCDNVVFPASTATLPGADNRLLPGAAHVELAFAPTVLTHVIAMLREKS